MSYHGVPQRIARICHQKTYRSELNLGTRSFVGRRRGLHLRVYHESAIWRPLSWSQLLSKIPRSRRVVIDCDGKYNEPHHVIGELLTHQKETPALFELAKFVPDSGGLQTCLTLDEGSSGRITESRFDGRVAFDGFGVAVVTSA